MIELMVAVAIVSILAAIAYPSYRNYVIRGQVVQATNGLSQASANMERWFQDNRTYTGGPCTTATQTYGTFSLTCTVTSSSGTLGDLFTITATGSNATNGFTYTINQAGVQATSVVSPAPTIWRQTCASSWEVKEGTC